MLSMDDTDMAWPANEKKNSFYLKCWKQEPLLNNFIPFLRWPHCVAYVSDLSTVPSKPAKGLKEKETIFET